MAKQLFKIILLCITFCFIINSMEKTKLSDAATEDKAELVLANTIENASVMSDIDKFMNLDKTDINLFLDFLDHKTDIPLTHFPEIFRRIPLHIAASYGIPKHIELAVRLFQDPLNDLDNYGNTALHYASRWGTPNNISCLIKLGFNKESAKQQRVTPLHVAAAFGAPDNISRLIELGCNKEAIDAIGKTPLHYAAAFATPDNISRLIELGCNKEASDEDGATPLHYAATKGTPANISRLIELGCDKEAANKEKQTPLHYAAAKSTPANISRLIELGCHKEAPDNNGATPLHHAAQYDTPDNISRLIELGCNKEAANKEKQTPLHYAAAFATPDNISRLIELGCNKQATTTSGATALHYAAAKGTPANISRLIELGCDKDATTKEGATPLHHAAKYGTPDNISCLIELGFSKEAIDEFGATPLHCAAEGGKLKNISCLIERGCNKEATNKYGETLLDYVVHSPHPEIANQLNALGVKQKVVVAKKTEYTLDELSEIKEMDSLSSIEQLKIVDLSITQLMRSNNIQSLEKLSAIIEIFEQRCSRLKKRLDDEVKRFKKDKTKKKELDKDIKKIENLIDIAKKSHVSNRSRIKSLQDAERSEEKKQLRKAKELQKKLAKEEAKKTVSSAPTVLETPANLSITTARSNDNSPNEVSAKDTNTQTEDLSPALPNTLKISSEKQELIAPLMNPIHVAAQNSENSKEKPQKPKLKKRLSQLFSQAEQQITSEKKSKKKHEFPLPAESKASKRAIHSSESQQTPESSQDKTPRNPNLQRRHSQFFSMPESESQLTSSARAPLLRTVSLANLSNAPRPASYKRLSRQLSSSDLRKITDIKFSETDITKTLEQLREDGLIEYRNEDNKISANKIGDHTVALTIHMHTTKNKEWTQNPSIIKDFLEFVHAVNPELYDAIKA